MLAINVPNSGKRDVLAKSAGCVRIHRVRGSRVRDFHVDHRRQSRPVHPVNSFASAE